MRYWELSIQPPKFGKFQLEIKFGSVRPDYLGPPLKVVHFDRSTHFGRSDRNVPFYLTNCCSQYCSFASCLQEQYPDVRWLGFWSVYLELTISLGTWSSQNFKLEFLLNRKHSLCLILHRAVVIATIPACNNFTVRVNIELLTA